MMTEANKSHERGTQFFASTRSRNFRQELIQYKISDREPPFVELSFKCCGYGYFPDFKKAMEKNFIRYLADSVACCQQVISLKIIYNGFDVSYDSLIEITNIIASMLKKGKLKTLWLKTTNLTNCREEDFTNILDLIDKCGMESHCEEIDIQMSDWQFAKGYPEYRSMMGILESFSAIGTLNYKKFRLQISSWYYKQKEAVRFLKETLSIQDVIKYFQSLDTDNHTIQKRGSFSRLKNDDKDTILDGLIYYLQNMDERFLYPNERYKVGGEGYSAQNARVHREMLQKMAATEQLLKKKLVKYPNDLIMRLRVEEFHKRMAHVLGHLLQKLSYVQEYHIDLRNWHRMFDMASLKKILDTKVNQRPEYLLARGSTIRLGIADRSAFGQKEEKVGLKTIYIV